MKAIVPKVEIAIEKKKLLKHPTRRHILANTVCRICKLNLTLRRIGCFSTVPPNFQYQKENELQRTRAIVKKFSL